jgi:integration host factor subunit beta
MTKSDLIAVISARAGITRVRAEPLVNAVFDTMVEALMNGDRIEIRDFGSFVNRQYNARKGRNPRTGAVIEVKPKRLPHFKAGRKVLKMINS